MISKRQKKVRTALNYIEHFLILVSTITITGFISFSTFTSLIGIYIGITSSAVGLEIYTIAAGIKKYKLIIKKKKKRHHKMVFM